METTRLITETRSESKRSQLREATKLPILLQAEYILQGRKDTTEAGRARWELMQAVARVLPEFLEELNTLVSPAFVEEIVDDPDSIAAPKFSDLPDGKLRSSVL